MQGHPPKESEILRGESTSLGVSQEEFSEGVETCNRSLIGKFISAKAFPVKSGLKTAMDRAWKTPFTVIQFGKNCYQFVFDTEENPGIISSFDLIFSPSSIVVLSPVTFLLVLDKSELKLFISLYNLFFHQKRRDNNMEVMERGNSRSLSDGSQRRKLCVDSVDGISDLPDSILGHILSFLPIKIVVATHILSQRWKFLWTKTTDLDFHYTASGREGNNQFVKFVDYFLRLHKREYLNRFSLTWETWCMPFHVNKWLGIAVARNVQEIFTLSLGMCRNGSVLHSS